MGSDNPRIQAIARRLEMKSSVAADYPNDQRGGWVVGRKRMTKAQWQRAIASRMVLHVAQDLAQDLVQDQNANPGAVRARPIFRATLRNRRVRAVS